MKTSDLFEINSNVAFSPERLVRERWDTVQGLAAAKMRATAAKGQEEVLKQMSQP